MAKYHNRKIHRQKHLTKLAANTECSTERVKDLREYDGTRHCQKYKCRFLRDSYCYIA